jgi:hypothetical protein
MTEQRTKGANPAVTFDPKLRCLTVRLGNGRWESEVCRKNEAPEFGRYAILAA